MADITVEKKKGGDFTWIWAAASVVAMLGLMAWLFSTREAVTTAAAPEAAPPAAETGPAVELTAPPVAIADIQGLPDNYYGQEIQLSNVTVADVLGERAFWASTPDAQPLLVVLAPDAGETGWIAQGATVSVQGTLMPVFGAEFDQWVQDGTLRADAQANASSAAIYLIGNRGRQE